MPAFFSFPTSNAKAPLRRCMHAQQGAAAVEFALLLPILLLIFFGIIELSLALYNKAVLTNASREGARAGIVLSSPKMTEAQIRDEVVLPYTQGALLSMGSSQLPTVSAVHSTSASGSSVLNVTVRYTHAGLGLGRMLSGLDNPLVLTSSTVMANE